MRLETAGSIGGLLIMAAMVAWAQLPGSKTAGPDLGCAIELAVIDAWKIQRLIYEVRPQGQDLVAIVDWRGWAKLPRSNQLQIGKALYCPVAMKSKTGLARIETMDGGEIARVEAGKWSSKQFPE